MKSSFWVLCGVVLLCFGSARCKRHFSDNDDNFLDKTGEGDKIRTEKEEDSEWQLYKARTVWNDLTNEINELSRIERSDEEDHAKCIAKWPKCEDTGGTCSIGVGGDDATMGCDCKAGITYDEETGCKVTEAKCKEAKSKCKDTGGTCSIVDNDDGETIECDCKAGITYSEETGCSVTEEKCKEAKPKCKDTGGTCSVADDDAGGTIQCDCKADITYSEDTGCRVTEDKCKEVNPKCKDTGGTCSVVDDGAGGTIKCNCKAGITYREDTGCSVTDDKCKEANPKCKDTGGTCSVVDDGAGGTIKCNCKAGITYSEDTGCSVTEDKCKEANPKCKDTGGTCSVVDDGAGGTIKCNCKAGITYSEDTGCSVTEDKCKEAKPKCKDTGGTCSVADDGAGGTIKCDCKAGITYSEQTGCNVTETKCKEAKPKCKDTGGTCSVADDVDGGTIKCDCKAGITYNEDTGCSVTEAKCKEAKPKCKDTGGTCSVDGETIKCVCKAGITYSEQTGCNVPDAMCKEQKPKCKDTGGTCSVADDGETIKCDCKAGITYTAETGCNVTVDLCNSKKPKCLDTGGSCSVDITTNDVKCVCKEGMNYTAETGCSDPCDILKCFNGGTCSKGKCSCVEGYKGKNCEELSKAKCEEELQICSETGGTCISKDDEPVGCKCPKDKEFDDGDGCKDNFCKTVCGDKEGVVCNGDVTIKDDIKCSCETEGKAFDTDAKECKDDKCFTVCGIVHTEKDGDVKCTNGPFGNVKCVCKEAKNAFDANDKECKKDYCKEKCGGETARVKCDGNIFEESELVCKCNYENEDFNATTKKCQINYCKKICGTDKRIKCDNPYTTKRTTDCTCDDDSYQYKNKRCIEKCSDDDECEHEGKCKGAEGSTLCECTRYAEGDKCEVLKACESGIYKNCKGENGKCVFNKDKPEKAECECSGGKKLYEALGYCADSCEEDKDCDGSNRKCNKDKFCVCKPGYEGEDCKVVTGCSVLEEKCKEIKTKCVFDENNIGKGKCECKDGYTYNRDKNECQDPYCFPNSPCKEGVCKYDDSLGGGYCECEKDKIYNYKTDKCEDLIDKCLLRKTPCGEAETCKNGECKCKYTVKEGEKCERKYCASNLCFTGAKCKDKDYCYCEEGKYYKDKKCQDAKCWKDFKRNCNCPAGTKRKEKGEECAHIKEEEACSKDCGYGICIKKNKEETCKCFSAIAEPFGGKCVLKKSFCEGGQIQNDLMRCKCEGRYTQADDEITCRLKTCDDEGVKEECAAKGGKCEMKWKEGGFICKCPEGYEEGANGKCTDVCSIEKYIKNCADKGMFCYNTITSANNKGTCGCPPTLKGDKCSAKAENVFLIKNIFVLKKRYELESGINQVLLSADLMKSMELTFSRDLFQSGYLYDYRIEGSVVNCSVWINFNSAPSKAELNKIKLMSKTVSKACDGCEDNAILWPPNVLLSDKGLQEAVPTKLEFCSNEVKDRLCGKGSKCKDNKCTCDEGFKLIEYSIQKVSDYEIHRCEDIDECVLGIDACSKNKNTICVNTFGSYKCVCKEGFKKKETPKDPETDKSDCYDMCSPSPCIKGECLLKNKTFDCKCQTGVTGSFCDRADEEYKSAKKGTVVVGAVLGTLLAVIVLGVLFYIIKKKKRSGSEDFMPAPRLDHAEMAERRGMRGVSNKAYE